MADELNQESAQVEQTEQELIQAWQMKREDYDLLMNHVQQTNQALGEIRSQLTIVSRPAETQPEAGSIQTDTAAPEAETLVIQEAKADELEPERKTRKQTRTESRKRLRLKRKK